MRLRGLCRGGRRSRICYQPGKPSYAVISIPSSGHSAGCLWTVRWFRRDAHSQPIVSAQPCRRAIRASLYWLSCATHACRSARRPLRRRLVRWRGQGRLMWRQICWACSDMDLFGQCRLHPLPPSVHIMIAALIAGRWVGASLGFGRGIDRSRKACGRNN
jgi:hypothetical protein